MMDKERVYSIERHNTEVVKSAAGPTEIRAQQRKRLAAFLIAAFLLVFGMLAAPATSSARVSVGVFVNFGPPALPYYVQPPCPAPGYIWTPGYWAWAPPYGYYWVPGAWVAPPFVGALWTPGYWDRDDDDDGYRWRPGYWSTRVGFYGGIDYGYGYTGNGYHGGYWNHGSFFYNRAVNRIDDRRFAHAYYRGVDEHFRERHISYHGPGGVEARPARGEFNPSRERRFGPVAEQVRQDHYARNHAEQHWDGGHGHGENGHGHGENGHGHGNDHGRGGRH